MLRASTFWYHPHIQSNEQVEKGLYGMLVVHDPDEDDDLGLPRHESWLVLDDIKLDDSCLMPFDNRKLRGMVEQQQGYTTGSPLKSLPDSIPEIISLEVGIDVVGDPRAVDLGLVVRLPDREALQRYIDHPAHQRVVAALHRRGAGVGFAARQCDIIPMQRL